MGFNISGIAIDASYEHQLDQLQQDLNLTLEYQEDVIFEKASSNWTDEGTAYLYFSGDSTLLFLHMDMCIEPFAIENKKTLTFALSEVSMAFCLNYCEGKTVRRAIMEHSGEKMSEEGVPFDFEANCEDSSEIIWQLLDDVLDGSFHSIDLGAPAKKYKVSYGRPQIQTPILEAQIAPSIGSKEHQAELEKKYSNFSNEQLQMEFNKNIKKPYERPYNHRLAEVTALMKISENRGIELKEYDQEPKKDKMGCLPLLVFGFSIASGITSYLIY